MNDALKGKGLSKIHSAEAIETILNDLFQDGDTLDVEHFKIGMSKWTYI